MFWEHEPVFGILQPKAIFETIETIVNDCCFYLNTQTSTHEVLSREEIAVTSFPEIVILIVSEKMQDRRKVKM